MVKFSQELSNESDELRKQFIEIAEIFQPIIEKAGISYKDEEYCRASEWHGEKSWDYLGICKIGKAWILGIHEEWEFDPEMAESYPKPFNDVNRVTLRMAVARLPVFLSNYAEELKRVHKKYKDAADSVKKMRAAL